MYVWGNHSLFVFALFVRLERFIQCIVTNKISTFNTILHLISTWWLPLTALPSLPNSNDHRQRLWFPTVSSICAHRPHPHTAYILTALNATNPDTKLASKINLFPFPTTLLSRGRTSPFAGPPPKLGAIPCPRRRAIKITSTSQLHYSPGWNLALGRTPPNLRPREGEKPILH